MVGAEAAWALTQTQHSGEADAASAMRPTVLITGFGSFPGAPFNPSGLLALRLARRRRPALADAVRIAHVFRTSYAAVEHELPALVARHQPDVILMLGLATRSRHLRIETRATNRRSVLFADVDGCRPERPAIRPGAEFALRGRASAARLLVAAGSAGVCAKLSRDAGKYLCNFSYWRALECAGSVDLWPLVQFLHVPTPSPTLRCRQAGARPAVTLERLVQAGEAILLELAAAARRRRIASTRPIGHRAETAT